MSNDDSSFRLKTRATVMVSESMEVADKDAQTLAGLGYKQGTHEALVLRQLESGSELLNVIQNERVPSKLLPLRVVWDWV